MKDSELLERAATAAGYKWQWFGANFCTERDKGTGLHKPWNPLEDDGDALRLAVKLGFQIVHRHRIADPTPVAVSCGYGSDDFDRFETMYEGNPLAATRRAITLAAAALAERSAAPTPLTGATKPNVPDPAPAPSLEGVRNA